MDKPETHLLMVIESAVNGQTFSILKREPIPWCTTHNQALGHAYFGPKDGACMVSFGSPDHKWWKDV